MRYGCLENVLAPHCSGEECVAGSHEGFASDSRIIYGGSSISITLFHNRRIAIYPNAKPLLAKIIPARRFCDRVSSNQTPPNSPKVLPLKPFPLEHITNSLHHRPNPPLSRPSLDPRVKNRTILTIALHLLPPAQPRTAPTYRLQLCHFALSGVQTR